MSYYEQWTPLPAGWNDRPRGVSAVRTPYHHMAQGSPDRRWDIGQVQCKRLHQLVDPDAVADRIIAMTERWAPSVTEPTRAQAPIRRILATAALVHTRAGVPPQTRRRTRSKIPTQTGGCAGLCPRCFGRGDCGAFVGRRGLWSVASVMASVTSHDSATAMLRRTQQAEPGPKLGRILRVTRGRPSRSSGQAAS